VSHPDQLTASAPVLDCYCFTLNFRHATGASLYSHNVPTTVLSNATESNLFNHRIGPYKK